MTTAHQGYLLRLWCYLPQKGNIITSYTAGILVDFFKFQTFVQLCSDNLKTSQAKFTVTSLFIWKIRTTGIMYRQKEPTTKRQNPEVRCESRIGFHLSKPRHGGVGGPYQCLAETPPQKADHMKARFNRDGQWHRLRHGSTPNSVIYKVRDNPQSWVGCEGKLVVGSGSWGGWR